MLRSDKEITTEIPDWILTSWMESNYHAGQVWGLCPCVHPPASPRSNRHQQSHRDHIVTCKMEIKSWPDGNKYSELLIHDPWCLIQSKIACRPEQERFLHLDSYIFEVGLSRGQPVIFRFITYHWNLLLTAADDGTFLLMRCLYLRLTWFRL